MWEEGEGEEQDGEEEQPGGPQVHHGLGPRQTSTFLFFLLPRFTSVHSLKVEPSFISLFSGLAFL